jgi:hypothetical protein
LIQGPVSHGNSLSPSLDSQVAKDLNCMHGFPRRVNYEGHRVRDPMSFSISAKTSLNPG